MQPTYIFWSDPGHGWLEVPLDELRALRLDRRITRYSYADRDAGRAYLEEDCDAPAFVNEWQKRNPGKRFADHVREEYREYIWIRHLPRY